MQKVASKIITKLKNGHKTRKHVSPFQSKHADITQEVLKRSNE